MTALEIRPNPLFEVYGRAQRRGVMMSRLDGANSPGGTNRAVPIELELAAAARARDFAQAMGQVVPNEVRFGQLWVATAPSDPADPSEGASRLVVVLDPAIDELDNGPSSLLVVPTSLAIAYQAQDDLLVREGESPLGFPFMVETWNSVTLLRSQLGRYLGILQQPLKRYIGLLYQARLGLEVDLSALTDRLGPTLRHPADPRRAFQATEIEFCDPLRAPALARVWAIESLSVPEVAAQAATVSIEKAAATTAPPEKLMRTLASLGWFPKGPDIGEMFRAFLQVPSLNTAPQRTVSFRQSKHQPDVWQRAAWLQRVENLARDQQIGPFDRERTMSDLPELLGYTASSKDAAHVPTWLLNHGVHFIIVENLDQTNLDGAALWVDGMPVVALTLRWDRFDNFWMTVLHELAHILLGHNTTYLDDFDEEAGPDGISEEERQANEWAQNLLVDPAALAAFVEQTGGVYTMTNLSKFAKGLHRSPWVVVGRLNLHSQHPRLLKYRTRALFEPWIDVPQPIAIVEESGEDGAVE